MIFTWKNLYVRYEIFPKYTWNIYVFITYKVFYIFFFFLQ